MPRNRCTWLMMLLVLILVAPVRAEPRRLTIASYNVLNMMDVFDDPYTSDEETRIKPREEEAAVAGAIKALDPDVCAITELENEGILRALAQEYLGLQNYKFIHAGYTNDGRGVRTGLLSRVPILSATSYRFRELKLPENTQTWHFARDLTRIELQATASHNLYLFVVHLKSRHDSPNDKTSANWRLAEATEAHRQIREILDRDAGAWIAMIGDFNDTPGTATIKLFTEPHNGKPATLIDMHAQLPAEQRITYLLEPYRSTIDYVLASPGLAKYVVKGSAKVLHDPSLINGSDHAPIAVTFELPQ